MQNCNPDLNQIAVDLRSITGRIDSAGLAVAAAMVEHAACLIDCELAGISSQPAEAGEENPESGSRQPLATRRNCEA